MALTIDRTVPHRDTVFGNLRVKFRDLALDDSYPTGGYALTPGDFGLRAIQLLCVEEAGGFAYEYDRANEKLVVYETGGLEVTAAVDLSAVTDVRVMAVGVR